MARHRQQSSIADLIYDFWYGQARTSVTQRPRRQVANVRRSFAPAKDNFESIYAPLVNAWVLHDNADAMPVLIDWSEKA